MAKKVLLQRKIDGNVLVIHPQTSADQVMYSDDYTIKQIIDAVILELRNLEDILCINSVYLSDEYGNLLDDGSGTNLTVVASLIANTEESGS